MLTSRTAHADLIEEALAKVDKEKQDLAYYLGVRPSTISKWLRSDHPSAVPPHHWELVCEFLGIPWKYWLMAAQEEVPADVIKYKRLVRSLSRRQA